MSVKHFNRQFSIILNESTVYGDVDEAHLHCLLEDTINKLDSSELSSNSTEIPNLLSNIHQVTTKCGVESAVFWDAVSLLEKAVSTLQEKRNLTKQLRILPILTNVLDKVTSHNHNKIDHVLKLIQDITFDITVKSPEPYLELLFELLVKFVISEHTDHLKFRKPALSILLSLCQNHNAVSLQILSEKINLVDFQKKVTIATYGILACKSMLVLNNYGHLQKEADVRNFMAYASKELKNIPSLDDKSLQHLITFLKEVSVSVRGNIKQVLQNYDFHSGLQGAMMILENANTEQYAHQINAFLDIVKIIFDVNNHSMKNSLETVLNFTLKFLKSKEFCVRALETLISIFNYDSKISTTRFDNEEMETTLRAILFSNERQQPQTITALLKLLSVLGKAYKVSLLNANVVSSILDPLLKLDNPEYFNLRDSDIKTYLQCLSTVSVLLECRLFDMKVNIFDNRNVRFLIGMSIKHGTFENCSMALSLVGPHVSTDIIAKTISEQSPDANAVNDPDQFMQNNQTFAPVSTHITDINSKKITKLTSTIEASIAEKKLPTNDFIELYSVENAMLREKVELLTKKLNDVSKEITIEKSSLFRSEATSMKWCELAKNLQKCNDVLVKDKEELNDALIKLKAEVSKLRSKDSATAKVLDEEKKKSQEMAKKLESLESEINDVENLRLTVISLMSKRKKNT